jgi:2-dehydropantoate 2-reductase
MKRFVVYGAGAVGGVLGARLAEHGHEVVLIARGRHYDAIRERGLRVESPDAAVISNVPVVDYPARLSWTADDIVLLTMKTQDVSLALRELAAIVPPRLPIVCLQNGVESERLAVPWFAHVYGVCVICPATYLTPGVVQAWSSPVSGILDVGRYPNGTDGVAEAVATAFRASTFASEARPDIMRWKYGKLLMNLGNAVEAICGPPARHGSIGALARREGIACLEAAGIDYVSEDEDAARRGDILRLQAIGGQVRQGGSSWQSLQRQAHSIEADYLNGEVARLGRLHGVPTPVNDLLQRLANRMAREGTTPGALSQEEFLDEVLNGGTQVVLV